MKIPGFQFSGVPGAEQQPIGHIANAARAKMGVSNTLTKVISEYGERVQQAEQKAEYNRATQRLERDSQALWDDLQGQPQYDDDENPTYNNLMPEFEKGISQLKQQRFQFQANEADFTAFAQQHHDRMNAKVSAEVRQRQLSYLQGEWQKGLIHYQTDLDNGYTRAQELTQNMIQDGTIDPAPAARALDAFRRDWQGNVEREGFENQRAIGEAQAYLDNFVENPPVDMPEDEQGMLIRHMQSLINSDESVRESERKALAAALNGEQKLLIKQGKEMVTVVESGHLLSDEFIRNYHTIAKQITDVEAQQTMQNAMANHKEARELVLNSDIAQLQQRKQELSTPVDSIEESERQTALTKAIDSTLKGIQDEPYQMAVQLGLLKPQQAALEDVLAEGGMADYLNEYTARKAVLDAHWKTDIPMLPKADIPILAAHLDKARGAGLLRELVTAAGPDSNNILAQIYQHGYQELAIMGDLMNQQDGRDAVGLLAQAREMDGELMPVDKDTKVLFNDYITVEDFTMIDDWQMQSALYAASKKAYAALSARAGDTTGEFNEDRYQKAMQTIIGDVVELDSPGTGFLWEGNYKLIAPRRDMDAGAVKDWLENLPEGTFDSVAGWDASEILNDVRDGDFRLLYTGEQGRYNLDRLGQYVYDQNGQPFVLEYQ